MPKVSSSKILEESNFSLNNLQPVNYLKTFNKMLDYMQKSSVRTSNYKSQSQLKPVKLSKFPLPQYYYQMQGIAETTLKKNNQFERQDQAKIAMEKMQAKFMQKHFKFVKNTLHKIIQDNSSQQKYLENNKKFHSTRKISQLSTSRPEQIRLTKFKSQPKFKSLQKTNRSSNLSNELVEKKLKIKLKHKQTQKAQNMQNITRQNQQLRQTSTSFKQQSEVQNISNNPIFKRIQSPKKNQRFSCRKPSQLNQMFSQRTLAAQESQALKVSKKSSCIYPPIQKLNHARYGSNQMSIQSARQPTVNQAKSTINQGRSVIKQGKSTIIKESSNGYQNYQNQQEEEQRFRRDLQQFYREIKVDQRNIRQNQLQAKLDRLRNQELQMNQMFHQQVVKLQHEQMQLQRQYGSRIDAKIIQLKNNMNNKIKQVYKFDIPLRKIITEASMQSQNQAKKAQQLINKNQLLSYTQHNF